MKKLYTLILAAASASMMFAQMPIMQQHFSLGSEPVLKQLDKKEVAKLYKDSKSLPHFNAQNQVARLKAPSRAEGGKLTLNDLCKMDFVQSYTPAFQGQTDQEWWGDIYFTTSKGENVVLLTGLFGNQDECYGDITIRGTFDEETQTISFPYEQLVYQTMQYKYYFSGVANVFNEDKTDFVDSYDYTEDDSFVLSIKEFDGQYAIRPEGSFDNSWDEMPLFGFYVTDTKDNGLGWMDVTLADWFTIANPNATITYQYVKILDDKGEEYDILDYDGIGFAYYLQLGEGGNYAFQMGPFTTMRYGLAVMFEGDDYGDFAANETYMYGDTEYDNPAFIYSEKKYYLYELTETDSSLGVYLNLNENEEGIVESLDFDGLAWSAMTFDKYWLGECGPAHIEWIGYESTGIQEVAADKVKDSRWFNLQGIEVNKDKLQKGNIYINDGKKVLVK